MGKSVPKFDRRLIGTWQSDRRRTFQHFKPRLNCSPRSVRKLKAIFGKLVVRWGRGKVYSEYDGHHDSETYKIAASDSESVVVRTKCPLTGDNRLQQIHFDGNYYWVGISGSMIEWFKKVKKKRKESPD
jgi:hypothetical protein